MLYLWCPQFSLEVKKELEQDFNNISFDSIVLYRLPHKSDCHLILGQSEAIENGITETHLVSNGFVFEPFDNSVTNGVFINHAYSHSFTHLNAEEIAILTNAFEIKTNDQSVVIDDLESYEKHFNNILNAIDNQKIDKAILSRIIKGSKVAKEQVICLFQILTKKYPHAFVYAINTPEHGIWIGAGPELLLKHQAKQLSTVSLAGTIANDEKSEWSNKELIEQNLVTEYIENVVIKHHTQNIEYSEPQTVIAGQVKHLCSTFTFELPKVNGNHVGLIYDLHPTPAVCGMPKDESFEIILNTEKHDRQFYSGFLGPVNNGQYEFYVNIRCLKVMKETSILFVGGGLTKDSVMKQEWLETELKAQTLLSALKNI